MTTSLASRIARLPAVVAIALATVAGCGQKGPLYLPGNPSEISTEVPKQETQQNPPAAEPQAVEEEGDDKDDEVTEQQP